MASPGPALDVTDGQLDVWRPTVTVDDDGVVHVAWAQQVDENWDIYHRAYTPGRDGADGSWNDVTRLTDAPGTDFHVVSTLDSEGRVWLAWQAWRDGDYDIHVLGPDLEGTPKPITDNDANDWSPALAADNRGNVYVAWDTYEAGNYDVYLRNVATDAEALRVADSPRFEARPSFACDRDGRLWIAYEQGDVEWGKDYSNDTPERVPVENGGYALYINRTVRLKCLDGKGSRLQEPEAQVEAMLADALGRNVSLPRLSVDEAGALWMLVRHHPLASGAGEVWVSSATRFDGSSWSSPMELPESRGLLDNRPALVPLSSEGILVVRSSDDRIRTANRDQADLFASVLGVGESTKPGAMNLVASRPAPAADKESVHPNEGEDIARMRAFRVEVGGKSLRLLRGEFHRHTELTSHRDQDGLLEDSWRYALDAADHDWMGNGDHLNGFGYEYLWWLVQKMTDFHHHAPNFVAAQTYERSARYPNGHRNVILPKRGIRPLPFGDLTGTPEEGTPDTKELYQYLKHFGGMCASHTSGTSMGTDWRDNDPEVEPVVEIYQGHRHNYEHAGAPRSPTAETQIGGFEPAGFVWNALEKGYRLGFQSSSDHVSTHLSYAVLLTDDASRQGVIDAFKKRHSYAATNNIILVVRSGDQLMGDAFETTRPPTLQVKAVGTTAIARLHVIRDNRYVLSTEPGQRDVDFTYTDDDAKPGESHYYYVRVEQADSNLAWASPMWITYKK